MEKIVKLDPIQPRSLRYRTHYKIYLVILLTISAMVFAFWGHRLTQGSFTEIYKEFSYELGLSGCYFFIFGSFYFLWLKNRLNKAVQVYSTHVSINEGKVVKQINFSDVESVGVVCWSLFYFKMNNGMKYFFNSSLERVDYIWEGFNIARPGVIDPKEFEDFRLKLVQYDHHQKRKEWFFRHKLVDVFNWIVMPLTFMAVSYAVQSQDVVIHHQGFYFFRLFMYSVLSLMITTFFFSWVLKKFVFDKKIKIQMSSQTDDKLRDIEFEGVILQRSKIMQVITTCFIFAIVIHSEVNLFSVTKIKENLVNFDLKQGHTMVVDNRFNCTDCKYQIKDGDIVVFGKGVIGQVMAKGGDMVGQVSEDSIGRTIASENIQEVPHGHIAVRISSGKEIVLVKLDELIGKIQK